MEDCILVTGGAGFIGSNFILDWLQREEASIVNLDKLTYAANPLTVRELEQNERYKLVRADVCDEHAVVDVLTRERPRAVVHFAAETHVDRSLHFPKAFLETNVTGTHTLLLATLRYWQALTEGQRDGFRFIHISTDEVYGSLAMDDLPVRENAPYAPSSPYSATKAAADQLVGSFYRTYSLPVVTVVPSNNFGPRQFPEKLIPLMIRNALRGECLPIYGSGLNVRDWIYVGDQCAAVRVVAARGRAGERYHVGGGIQIANLDLVRELCAVLDELRPTSRPGGYASLIAFVEDRPAHDLRYALDCLKIADELGWRPEHDFRTALRTTVRWYLDREEWLAQVDSETYRNWLATNYPVDRYRLQNG